MKRILFILLATLMLAGCYNHEPSSPAIINMTKTDYPVASLSNKQLSMRIVSGTGEFRHLDNVTVVRICDAKGNFKTYLPGNMQFLYAGTYKYHTARNKNNAYLTLNFKRNSKVVKVLSVQLHFRNSNNGIFRAKLIRGGTGTQQGLFEINIY